MNILFISPNSPYESVGGIERYIINLINYYRDKSEYGVFLILPTSDKSRIKKTGSVTIFFDNNFSIPRNAARHKKEISVKAQEFGKLLENIIKEKKIDVICAENIMFGPPAVYSLLINMIATSHKIPVVLRLHSFAISDLQIELISQLMWSKISCVSKSVAGDCFQKGTDVDDLSTHYLGVNTIQFNNNDSLCRSFKKQLVINESSRIILTATRIIRGSKNILQEKGLVNLIKAFSKLSSRYSNLYLLIAVGSATENLKNEFTGAYEMLLGYIKLHGIEKQTVVRTFKLDDMRGVYRESDVFVLPSENETFGQVFIEAMSCGIPVIGTKVGGIPEIISDTYNGYLVQPDDASILAQRIEKLLNDKITRESFKKAGIKTVKNNFTAEKQFSNFHKILEDAVSSKL
ncbi:MAG: glycosyltransferase family 4 protein [Actinobacteria bacterium]|nr:glycosyltransferase family 4 protein [Actinomycetota bacterium]